MDRDEAMAESHGDLVRRIRLVLDPISRVVDRLLHLGGDLMGVDADVPGSKTILPGPTPDVAKHPAMQLSQESAVQNVAP